MVLGPWVHPPLHLWVSSAPRATAWIQGSKWVLSSPLQWFPGGFQSKFQNYSDDRFIAPRENGYRQAGAESGGPSGRTSSRVSPVGAAAFCVFSPCTAGAVVPVTSVALSSPVALEKSSGADLVSRQRKPGATSYYGIGIDRCSVLANKPADFLLPSPASNGCCGNDATIPCR